MTYRIIDHTADIGIELTAGDAATLFARSALAMFDLLVVAEASAGKQTTALRVAGYDWADLMVNWLRELLYWWTGRQQRVCRVDIGDLMEHEIRARIGFEPFNPERHRIKHDIKAVTYHQVQVLDNPGGWQARVIFDV